MTDLALKTALISFFIAVDGGSVSKAAGVVESVIARLGVPTDDGSLLAVMEALASASS